MSRAPLRGRRWGPRYLTGGPVDEVFAQLRATVPGLVIERIETRHAADDDSLFFLGDVHGFERVHVETRPNGTPPFLIEGNERLETSDAAEAVAVARLWLEQEKIR